MLYGKIYVLGRRFHFVILIYDCCCCCSHKNSGIYFLPFRLICCAFAARHCIVNSVLLTSADQLTDDQKVYLKMAGAGARALYSLSESKPNKEAMRKFGLVPLMSRLLKSVHIDLVIPILGTCQNCASEVRKWQIII